MVIQKSKEKCYLVIELSKYLEQTHLACLIHLIILRGSPSEN